MAASSASLSMLLQGGKLLLPYRLSRASLLPCSLAKRSCLPSSVPVRYLNFKTLKARQAAVDSNPSAVVPVQDPQLQLEVQKRVHDESHKLSSDPHKEKFIPITRQALVSKLKGEEKMLSVEERDGLGQFAAALDAFISRRFYAQLERMKVDTTVQSNRA